MPHICLRPGEDVRVPTALAIPGFWLTLNDWDHLPLSQEEGKASKQKLRPTAFCAQRALTFGE